MSSAVIDPNNNDGRKETVSLLLMLIGAVLIAVSASPLLAAGIFALILGVLVNFEKLDGENRDNE